MKNNLHEKELRNQLTNIRKEINSSISCFNTADGAGFGAGAVAEEQFKYDIEYKKWEEDRLAKDLNDLLLKKIKKSANIAAWLAATAAFISAIVPIVTIFLQKP